MEDDDELDMCKGILYNEIGNANQKRRAMVTLDRQSHPGCSARYETKNLYAIGTWARTKADNNLHCVQGPSFAKLEHDRDRATLVYIKNWSKSRVEAEDDQNRTIDSHK